MDEALPGLAPGVQHPGQLAIGLRLERLERQVLELPLDVPDAQALRQWGVDLERLAGDPALLLVGQRVEGAHVVEPVCQLDQDDPDVVRHRQEHLPDVLGLLLLVAVCAELRELGDAVHELGDLGAELLLDVGEGEVGVLGNVVQDCGGDRDRVDTDVGEDLGGSERVGHVRLAGDPGLAAMGLLGQLESRPERLEVRLRIVPRDRVAEVLEARLDRRQDGQAEAQPICQRQAHGPAPLVGATGLGGGYRRFNRHRNESTSRPPADRPEPPPATGRGAIAG